VETAIRTGLERALNAGRLLLQAKGQCQPACGFPGWKRTCIALSAPLRRTCVWPSDGRSWRQKRNRLRF
jgi:hypothetical protein